MLLACVGIDIFGWTAFGAVLGLGFSLVLFRIVEK